MRIRVLCYVAAMLATAVSVFGQQKDALQALPDNYTASWVGTDALGRTMPTSDEVGLPKTDKDRVVGIFYITWHGSGAHKKDMAPGEYWHDVTKVLETSPAARNDNDDPAWHGGGTYHWGEPENGYFLSDDEWVMRKDIAMLADAGVDVLILDVTNAVQYHKEWHLLFKTMQKMKAEGNKVPKFCFWAFNGPVISVVQSLYEKYYKNNLYRDLWFWWDGKPLLLCNMEPMVDANHGEKKHRNPNYDADAAVNPENPHYLDPDYCNAFYEDYTREVKDFFTMRNMWWGYYKWNGHRYVGTEDNWSFGFDLNDRNVMKMDPTALGSLHDGQIEEYAVTPAQHPNSMVGKSWRRETLEPELDDHDMPAEAYVPWLGKTVKDPVAYGIYFQDRWDEALQADPAFLYLNDWNEWTAGKYRSGFFPDGVEGGPTTFLRRKNPFYFVDQYNAEFNRTISPMKGGYTDNYYMQMAQNIRRYKGVDAIPVLTGLSDFAVDGDFAKWDAVEVTYFDTRGDVAHRDHAGYGGNWYKDETGRNDIADAKVAVGADRILFYVRTAGALTPFVSPKETPGWMTLLIDADQDASTGWAGYDFTVCREAGGYFLYKSVQRGRALKKVAKLDCSVGADCLEIAVPRQLLGLTGDAVRFDFKWSDNGSDGNFVTFCTSGDSAPNRRFNFRCIWEK